MSKVVAFKPTPGPAEQPKRGRGRPPKLKTDDATLNLLLNLGKIDPTTVEVAAVLGVSEPTLIDFLKRNKSAAEALDRGRCQGRVSVRRAQLKLALEGNATMLIWVGKQRLGQKDKHEARGWPEPAGQR
jgi:hypothetical protein